MRSDPTPFPPSRVITGAAGRARATGRRPTRSGTSCRPCGRRTGRSTRSSTTARAISPATEVWKQSLARSPGSRRTSTSPTSAIRPLPAPHTFTEIRHQHAPWSGPIGPYYSSGLVEADGTLFATQQNDWQWGFNGPFTGLAGIASSTDHGLTWTTGTKPFPAPLGNLSWVIRGQGGYYSDGWVYALGTEREFNADRIVLGRARPDVAQMTDPSQWQWVSTPPSPLGGDARATPPRWARPPRCSAGPGTSPIRRWPTTRRCTSICSPSPGPTRRHRRRSGATAPSW